MQELLDTPLTPVAKHYTFKPLYVGLWTFFLLTGVFFQRMHWPSSLLILCSSGGLTAYAWSGWIRLRGKDMLNNLVSILSLCWLAILLWGIFYNEGYPYNLWGVLIFLAFFGIFFAIYLLINYFKYNFRH